MTSTEREVKVQEEIKYVYRIYHYCSFQEELKAFVVCSLHRLSCLSSAVKEMLTDGPNKVFSHLYHCQGLLHKTESCFMRARWDGKFQEEF